MSQNMADQAAQDEAWHAYSDLLGFHAANVAAAAAAASATTPGSEGR